jgi:hypothetical protein
LLDLELELELELEWRAGLGLRVLLALAVICCLGPYLAVLCLVLVQHATLPIHKQMHKHKPTSYCTHSTCNNALI